MGLVHRQCGAGREATHAADAAGEFDREGTTQAPLTNA
jgi:hypothetical protein